MMANMKNLSTIARNNLLLPDSGHTFGTLLTTSAGGVGRQLHTWEGETADNGRGGRGDGGEEEEVLNWYALPLLVFVLTGVMGNVLVCVAIAAEKRLQNITNYFLMSLALADLLVSVVVMPCAIVNELMGFWPFGLIVCNMWQTCDVMMCTSSIMHMCAISVTRYVGIRNPLGTRSKVAKLIGVQLLAVWLVSLALASPVMLLAVLSPLNVLSADGRQCGLVNRHFLIYGSLAAFFLPLLIMLFTYSLTIHLLRQRARACSRDEGEGGSGMDGKASLLLRRSSSKNSRRQNGSAPADGAAAAAAKASGTNNNATLTAASLFQASSTDLVPINPTASEIAVKLTAAIRAASAAKATLATANNTLLTGASNSDTPATQATVRCDNAGGVGEGIGEDGTSGDRGIEAKDEDAAVVRKSSVYSRRPRGFRISLPALRTPRRRTFDLNAAASGELEPLNANNSLNSNSFKPRSKRHSTYEGHKSRPAATRSDSNGASGDGSGSVSSGCNRQNSFIPMLSVQRTTRRGRSLIASSSPLLPGNNPSITPRSSPAHAPRFQHLVKKHSAAIRAVGMMMDKHDWLAKKRERNTVLTEQKAVKVLGTMFAIFVVCWAPFFTVNLAMGLCGDHCSIDERLFKVLCWLGYASSTVNPIVYTIFNKTFKQTFIDLLTCRRWSGQARIDKKALLYQHHNGNGNQPCNNAVQHETML